MFIVVFAQESFGQVANYTYQKSSGTFTNQASSTSTVLTGTSSWDDNIYSTTLPFAFTFNGTNYASGSTIYVDANGFIYFGGSSSSFPSNYVNAINDGASVNGIVAAFNQDLVSQTATFTATVSNTSTTLTNVSSSSLPVIGTVLSGTGIASGAIVTAVTSNGSSSTVTMSKPATASGSGKTITSNAAIITQNSGTGVFYIQWANAANYSYSSGFNFQIALNQTTNTINVIYGSISTSNNNGHQIGVSVGLGGSSTSDYNDLTGSGSSSTYWSTAVNTGTTSSSTMGLYSSQIPSSGQTYTWTPAPNLTTSSSSLSFSNVVSGTSSTTQTFTLSGVNLTGYPANITVTAPTGFLVYNGTSWVSSYTIAYTSATLSATTISVQFDPTTATSYSGNISFSGGGDVTPPTVALTGTGTASASSNIIVASGYTYNQNIAYASYQATSIPAGGAGSIELAQFTLQDGGGSSDADNLSTVLNSITFSVSNYANIRQIAIYDPSTNTVLAQTAGAATVTFNSLSITAADNGTKTFSIRASFNTTVTDGQNIGLTVTSATASSSGSGFAATNAGGAATSVAGNNDKISVTATKLLFVQNTSNVVAGVAMSPSVTIKEVDANGNTDTHDNTAVSVSITTTTETFAGTATTSATPVSGVATFSNLIFSSVQSGVTIAGNSTSGLTSTVNSNTFNVTASASSNIIATSGYTYTSPVYYLNYSAASGLTTSNSVAAMGLTLQDGGGSPDADNLPTNLTAITFSTGGSTAIRTAALFVSGVEVSSEVAVNGATSISFSSLPISAPDNSTANFELRVTYQATVTDQQQIQFTVTSVTASSAGSGFAATNGGGAVSSVSGNNNKIYVVATKLAFVQQPGNVSADAKMTPAVTIKEVDANGNIDTHDNYSVSVSISATSETFTSGATTTATSAAGTVVSGIATFSNLAFVSVQNGVMISGSSTSGPTATGNSNSFNVTAFVSSSTDYFKTYTAGDWAATSPYIWQGSHDGSNWYTPTAYPTSAAASILVSNNITVSSSVTSANLSISGGSITINNGGTVTNSSTSIAGATSADFIVNNGGTYVHSMNGGNLPLATWNTGSTCTVAAGAVGSSGTNTAPGNLGQSFYHFTWSSNLDQNDIELNSGLTTINGNFTFSSSNSSNNLILAHNSSLTLKVGGNFSVQGSGSTLIITDGSSSPVINITGNLSVSNGSDLDFADGSGSGIIYLTGNYSLSGASSCNVTNPVNGFYTEYFFSGYNYYANSGGAANGTINFVGANQTISNAATGDLSNINFNINAGSTVTVLSPGFAINNGPVNYNFGLGSYFYYSDLSTFTVSNGGSLICGTYNVTGISKQTSGSTTTMNSTFVLNNGGDLYMGSTAGITTAGTSSGNIQTATRTFNQGGNYIYNGSSNQSTGTGLPATLTDSITINNKSSVSLSQNTTVSGTLLLTNGNFNQSPNTLTFGSGSVIARDNGSLGSVPAFSGAVSVMYTNLGQNTLTQTTGNELPASTTILNNLTINKTGANITLGASATVNGVLYLTNGLLTTSSGALLSLSSSASASLAVTDYTNTSYVNGPLQKTGNTAFTFPIGKTGTGYLPIGISVTSDGASQTFRAEYIHASAAALGPIAAGSALQTVSSCDYWNLNLYNSSGTQISALTSGSIGVTLYWNQNNSSCNVIHDLSSLAIGHFSAANSNWDVIGMGSYSPVTGSSTNGSITYAGAQNFSPFALSSTNGINNPLPIIVDYFTTMKASGYNKLTWKVECTAPYTSFDVERSYDGTNFGIIGSVNVDSASACAEPFGYDDYNSTGDKIYYRIRINDALGNIRYTAVDLITNNTNVIELIGVQPNPVVGDGNLKIAAASAQNMEISVFGIDGKEIQRKTAQITAGTTLLNLGTSSLSKGIYFVRGIFANGQTNTVKFVKQ